MSTLAPTTLALGQPTCFNKLLNFGTISFSLLSTLNKYHNVHGAHYFCFLLHFFPKEDAWPTYLGSVAQLYDHILFFIANITLKSSSSFHFN